MQALRASLGGKPAAPSRKFAAGSAGKVAEADTVAAPPRKPAKRAATATTTAAAPVTAAKKRARG
ncbi:hypothetical protein BH10PSE17_BH10PSE17_01700 [soil metagenome]